MIESIKQFLGITPKTDYKELLKQGAVIIDVRTKGEYLQGHIKGSVNIPLNNLSNHYTKLNKQKQIITCCASGIRSGQAKSLLKANGFTSVHNGGDWISLKSAIS